MNDFKKIKIPSWGSQHVSMPRIKVNPQVLQAGFLELREREKEKEKEKEKRERREGERREKK